MEKIVKNILKKIENEGYEAYLVGGYVRDHILHHNSFDVDICTNALPKYLINIFPNNANTNNYGGFNLKFKKYNIDITTYRKESGYDKRKPTNIEYISNLFDDIKRRDFTINAICMDKNGNYIDPLNGINDIKNKVIKSIGNPLEKFEEDPLRMLRAIRFASVLNFKIDDDTLDAIKNHYQLVNTLSSERIKGELTKILSNKNYNYGLQLLKETKIDSIIGLKYNKTVFVSDILGMWAQIDCKKVSFTKTEEENIKKIKQILNKNTITNHELFNYGLYLCTVAGDILGYSRAKINKMFKSMSIQSMKDIDISGKEIIDLLNTKPSKLINDIMLDIKNQILNNKLKNHKNDIKRYILGKWKNE